MVNMMVNIECRSEASAQFIKNWLEQILDTTEHVEGFRISDSEALVVRSALREFAYQMEEKLIKNDHKTHWRELPIEALWRLLKIEMEEYQVAHEFLTVGDARKELIDVANFALILWDRLGLEKDKGRVKDV